MFSSTWLVKFVSGGTKTVFCHLGLQKFFSGTEAVFSHLGLRNKFVSGIRRLFYSTWASIINLLVEKEEAVFSHLGLYNKFFSGMLTETVFYHLGLSNKFFSGVPNCTRKWKFPFWISDVSCIFICLFPSI